MLDRRIVRKERPFNAETPLHALRGADTPTSAFYVRNHFDVPALDEATWTLRVDGAVERSLGLNLGELQEMPVRSERVTLECAGNARSAAVPPAPGVPWGFGAAGNATFTGVSLGHVLDAAGVRPDALELEFEGADRGEVGPDQCLPYARSLPVDVARRPSTLLAWEMNGEALSPEHGAPVRLVVPGWYGVASVKWLVWITALTSAFEGFFQRIDYRYSRDGSAIDLIKVRSVIASPGEGSAIELGRPGEIAGTAWSGHGRISSVEVSVDGGTSWSEARIDPAPSPAVATPWNLSWTPLVAGRVTIVARATDELGNRQPLQPVPDEHGYGNNVVHRVGVAVRHV